MNKTIDVIETDPKLFVTDYGSYNDGSQFEFGKWWNLTEFTNADEFLKAVSKHFKEADKKRPIPYTIREEIMFTDYEHFPDQLYAESCNSDDLQAIFDWMELDDIDKVKVEYLLHDGNNPKDALSNYDDVTMYQDDKYELFNMYYPETEEIISKNYYLNIDYDQFMKECFNEFQASDGEYYQVAVE